MQNKSEMINRIAELEEENAELKAYKDVNEDFKTAWEQLKAENERLKASKDKYYQQTLDDEIQINELLQTLQEIKEYAESIGNEEMINGYAIRAKSALWRIANMITKAEEE